MYEKIDYNNPQTIWNDQWNVPLKRRWLGAPAVNAARALRAAASSLRAASNSAKSASPKAKINRRSGSSRGSSKAREDQKNQEDQQKATTATSQRPVVLDLQSLASARSNIIRTKAPLEIKLKQLKRKLSGKVFCRKLGNLSPTLA